MYGRDAPILIVAAVTDGGAICQSLIEHGSKSIENKRTTSDLLEAASAVVQIPPLYNSIIPVGMMEFSSMYAAFHSIHCFADCKGFGKCHIPECLRQSAVIESLMIHCLLQPVYAHRSNDGLITNIWVYMRCPWF